MSNATTTVATCRICKDTEHTDWAAPIIDGICGECEQGQYESDLFDVLMELATDEQLAELDELEKQAEEEDEFWKYTCTDCGYEDCICGHRDW